MIDRSKENRGITLIALVITIIVLLILAGIAISMLSGENGILRQAAKAKENTQTSSTLEKVQLAVASAITNEKHIVDEGKLNEELAKYGLELDKKDESKDDLTGVWTLTENGIIYEIVNNGDVQQVKVPRKDYGKEINYVAPNDQETKWRILFDDGNNVYIISKDYMSRDKLPQTKAGHVPDIGLKTKTVVINTAVVDDYKDWATMIKENGIKNSLEKYHKWASKTENQKKDLRSIRAVAYLLDTDIWKANYVDEKYAEYAIGGPTIEMFCKSYNAKHTNGKTINYDENYNYGYKIKWSNDLDYSPLVKGLDRTEENNFWIINDSSEASGYFLASTNPILNYLIMVVSCTRFCWIP